MKKFQSLDGYNVYRVKKDYKFYYLADRLAYKECIDKLLDTVDDIKFDSLILIFGLDTGEYLQYLKEVICEKNRVIIFEPDKDIYERHQAIIDKRFELVYFTEQAVKKLLLDSIYYKIVNNVYFHAFGNYDKVFKKEYDILVTHLNETLINASSQISLSKRFKKVFLQNMIANLKSINGSTAIETYYRKNLNVPAIVVSAGPSLDKNIKDMLLYKEKLKDYFIITGSRSVKALIDNNIYPDMIVSVDPVDANYDMMKDFLHLEVPLAFYEYSNRYLVKEYQGSKVYIPVLFSQTIESFSKLKSIYFGGSVAHSCIDIANMLGCSPIILVGQDLAYTYEKHHADSASFDYDKTVKHPNHLKVKDVFGKDIVTSITLNHFRKRLEDYIEIYKEKERVQFINCSYGASIEGAIHKELKDILKEERMETKKTPCLPDNHIQIDSEEIRNEINQYIDYCMMKADQGIELSSQIIESNESKSLVEVEEEDIDLQKVLYMLDIINNFENAKDSRYLGGFMTEFLYEMKTKTFFMYAKDYYHLTSDLQHQARCLHTYFNKMKEMLSSVKALIDETVIDFFE